MIPKEELRLGIWIIDPNRSNAPILIDEDWLEVFMSIRNYEDLIPVLINPTILKAMGFIDTGNDDNHSNKLWRKKGFDYEWCEDGHFVDNTGPYGDYADFIYVEYLHQFQTAYYLLCQEHILISYERGEWIPAKPGEHKTGKP